MLRAGAAGLLLGTAWGVLARVWMRLISSDPEFSWSGTLAILGLSAALGLGVGLVHGARRSGRSGWWTLAVVPGLLLFMGPGMLLAPCFLLGGAAWGSRGRVLRVAGVLAFVLSLAVAAFLLVGSPEPGSAELRLGDVAVFGVGYVAMALSLAWSSSLVWQRRTRPTGVVPADRAVASAARVRRSAGWGP
jgi:hypothetical protein